MKFTKVVIGLLAFSIQGYGAETIVSKRINATNRLIPLKKITVGPDDQYQGSVDPSGENLVFTRKSDLIPHLCTQSIKTGEVKDLLPLSADSQEPAIGPDGRVAFTYYRYNARGDICYRPLKGEANDKFECLKTDEGERSSPFWKTTNELGYVLRDTVTQVSRILVQNISTGKKEILAEGRVWAPAMIAGGRYFFYNELVDPKGTPTRVLVLKDIKTSKSKALEFKIPGFSGFPSVSGDERYLFFSHYLNDTNNDNIIDGNDNSVVFRAPIETLLNNDVVFPEQLTSAESNCSFPRPYKEDLYATCAFEGNLDVYRLPTSGVVPSQWNEALLWSAHQTIRTYQERILILNTLKYRLKGRETDDLNEKILSDHLFADDTSAARYYLKNLQSSAKSNEKEFYGLLHVYLQAREEKKLQPSNEVVTPSFEKDIFAYDDQIYKVAGHLRFRNILRGLLRTFLNQPRDAAEFLKKARFDSPAHPLERYYYFELARWALPRVKSSEGLIPIYRDVISAKELSEESQIYYAFDLLQRLENDNLSIPKRVESIKRFNHDLPKPASDLLQSEESALALIVAGDEKGKMSAYHELDKVTASNRTDYFLRKAISVRAILNFAKAAEFNYLSLVAVNWLRYTTKTDTEFAYAREVYVNATLDQAYESFGKKNFAYSADYFYGSLSLTDDLESHFGYIQSMVLRNQRNLIETRYANLQKREFIDDNMKFVKALLILIDAHPSSRNDVTHLDNALELLNAMEQDRDSPVRYLLLAYCYNDKLFRLGDGYDFDTTLFEAAHRNLMLAYDVGRDNVRVKATALMELGIVHQRVQNHGLSVKFFAKRKELGFVSDDEAARFFWLYAKSLFYNHQENLAADALKAALNLPALPPAYRIQIMERRAFYLHSSGDFAPAASLYEKLFEENSIRGDINLAKDYLGYGYSLFKLKRGKEAEKALRTSLTHAGRLAVIPRGAERYVDFQPVRLQLDAYGLLSRMGSLPNRVAALEMRETLLSTATALFNDGLSLQIQNRLQLADLYSKTNPARAKQKMEEALEMTERLGESGQYLSHAAYQSTVDYLAYGILHHELCAGGKTERIGSVVAKLIRTYDSQKGTQPMLEYQKHKISALWAGYQVRVMNRSPNLLEEVRKSIAPSDLKADELKKLIDGI